jgi:predicted acetyltransferase
MAGRKRAINNGRLIAYGKSPRSASGRFETDGYFSPKSVILKIKDRLMPENNVKIAIGNGKAEISEEANDFEIEGSDLATLLTGRLSPMRLWRLGKLRVGS